MSVRKSLDNLNNSMADRASWARRTGAANPSLVFIDDQLLPWVFNEEQNMWFSFDGNGSSFSPAEKLEKAAFWERKREELSEEAILDAADRLYWGKIREFVLQRDRNTCQICGKSKTESKLHIHHICKRKEDGPDTPDNLITLCPKCHSNADKKWYNPDWL